MGSAVRKRSKNKRQAARSGVISLDRLVERQPRASRREFLRTGLWGAGGLFLVGSGALLSCAKRPPPVPRSYRPTFHTVAHDILVIEKEHSKPGRFIDDMRLLDLLIGDALRRVEPLEERINDPRRRALAFLEALHQMLGSAGFSYEQGGMLNQALRDSQVNCDSSSAIYLAVGEVLSLPIKMVRAPGHTFVRWEFGPGDYLNWETTRGAVKSDDYYISFHNIPKRAIGASELRSLDVRADRQSILANAYVNSGVLWLKKCDHDLAVTRFKQAIARDPLYVTPYYNVGRSRYLAGQPREAVQWCRKAVELNPNHLRAHAVLQAAYKALGQHHKSRKHKRKVLSLDQRYYSLHRARRQRRNLAHDLCT